MQISQEGVTLIKHYEGCPKDADGNAVSYRCPANKPTIGYGSLKLKDGTPVEDNMTITMEDAEELLAHELKEYEGYIHDLVKVKLNQKQLQLGIIETQKHEILHLFAVLQDALLKVRKDL